MKIALKIQLLNILHYKKLTIFIYDSIECEVNQAL